MMKLPLNTDLSGKVAVVTGAGGVLCGMFAQALAQAGAKVAVLDLNEEACTEGCWRNRSRRRCSKGIQDKRFGKRQPDRNT